MIYDLFFHPNFMINFWSALLELPISVQVELWATSIVILVALVRDILATVPIPKHVASILHACQAPFQDFLNEDDIGATKEHHVTVRIWKSRALSVLSLVTCIVWMTSAVYALYTQDNNLIFQSLVSSLAWVSGNLQI